MIAMAFVIAWATAIRALAAPLDAYGELPTLSDAVISGDGTKIAYLGEHNGEHFVVIQELKGQLIAAIKADDVKVRDLQWADDTHLVFTLSETWEATHAWQREVYQAKVFDLATKKQYNLLSSTGLYVAETPEVHVRNGHAVVLVEGWTCVNPMSDGCVLTLYSIDMADGVPARGKIGSPATSDYVADAQDQAVAEARYEQTLSRWSLSMRIGGVWQDIYSENASIDPPSLVGLSPDGTALEVASRKTGEVTMLAFSLADGKPVPSMLKGTGGVLFDRLTRRIAGERFVEHDVAYRFFDTADQQRWSKVLAHFPGEQVEYSSRSDDGNKVLVRVIGRLHGDAYELVDLASDTVTLIGQSNRRIAASDIARVTQFTYSASDGRQIDAYLTLPSGKEAQNLPLIVMPHGGPEARDEPGFDWWAQGLASLGYAVLQPEFRGSGEMGWDLRSAGFGQFGRKMETDLSDGVRALTRIGIVDAKRVCIVGASYGGYAALAGATIDRGSYRCAVSVGGISNPPDMVRAGRGYEVSRYWMRYLGVTSTSDPVLDTISPLKQVRQADIPILLIYGDNDSVVPNEQSKDMADALKAAGKPYTVVVLPGEDHWLSHSATRLQMLKATADFLKTNDPP